jgi:hypothetical protein
MMQHISAACQQLRPEWERVLPEYERDALDLARIGRDRFGSPISEPDRAAFISYMKLLGECIIYNRNRDA